MKPADENAMPLPSPQPHFGSLFYRDPWFTHTKAAAFPARLCLPILSGFIPLLNFSFSLSQIFFWALVSFKTVSLEFLKIIFKKLVSFWKNKDYLVICVKVMLKCLGCQNSWFKMSVVSSTIQEQKYKFKCWRERKCNYFQMI